MIPTTRWRSAVIVALSAILSLIPPSIGAQGSTGTIEGVVIDVGTRRPLSDATVSIVGTQIAVITNANGRYRLLNIAPGTRELRARILGFAPQSRTVTVSIGQTSTADFELSQSAIELSKVVTTGTGGALVEERKLGNTIAVIEPPPFAPIQSFSDVLAGREPSVSILPSSGLAGEGARIRIRGNASLSQSNEPIVYLDGTRIDNGGGFGQGFVGTGGGGQPSRLDDIDPNTIDRVEILKGAAAATLFGTEASNGVVQIFTKRGRSGPAQWGLSADQATYSFPKDRIEANYGFARSDTQATRLSQFYGRTIKPFEVFSQPFGTRLFETGTLTAVSGSVDGGTPLVTYYVSGRYHGEDGAFGGDNYKFGGKIFSNDVNEKYFSTVNLQLTPSQQFVFNVRSSYTQGHLEVPDNNNSIYSPYTLILFSKPERSQCNASRDSVGDPTNGVRSPGVCDGPGNPTGASSFATVREALQRSIKQDVRHFNGSFRSQYLPRVGLSFDGQVGIDYVGQRSTSFLPFGNNLDFRTAQANKGEKNVDDRTHQEITLGLSGNWQTNLRSNITSQLLFGTQGFLSRDNDESSTNTKFPGPGIEVVGGGSEPQVFEVFTSIVNAGFFAQEQIGLNDWIFATGGARYDYNSAFGENAGGVLYPQGSLSLILSDRQSWRDSRMSTLLPTLRLRAAAGRAGRQPGAFDKQTTYGPLTASTGGGLVPQNLGNPNIRPEVATEWELGTEIGFLDNKAAIEFTRWNRIVRDALVARQFPVTGGFRQLQLDNVGKIRAFGWELALNTYPINRPDFSMDLFFNTSFLSQLVQSLGDAPRLKVGGSYPRYRNFIEEGLPPGALLGAKLVGPCASGQTKTSGGGRCLQPGQLPFDSNGDGNPDTEAEFLAYLAARTPNPNSSSAINFVDPLAADDDNDGDPLDHYLGKSTPDFAGAFGGSMTIRRNWKLSSLFEYKRGNYTITDLTGAFRRSNNNNGGNTQLRAQTEATLLNPASTPEQKLAAAKTFATKLRALTPYDGLNQNFSGDFVRWRELSLTYTTSPRIARSVGASDLAITFGARNLKLWTKYPGADPEVNVYGRSGAGGTDNNFGDGIDAFGFPLARRLSINVKANF